MVSFAAHGPFFQKHSLSGLFLFLHLQTPGRQLSSTSSFSYIEFMSSVILSSAYLAPVQYFSKLYAASAVVEERAEHYVKQTYRNRCVIAAPSGPQALTIPTERTGAKTLMRDVRISEHGNWRHLHWHALTTAYEASPFFEYYADDFRPFYERPSHKYLCEFNADMRDMVLELLDLHPQISLTEHYADAEALGLADLREAIRPKHPAEDEHFVAKPYYQVFASRHGFLPNLSIVDLLFNMGPETRLVLRDCCV